jgi:Protein of unknown function (DUF1523)
LHVIGSIAAKQSAAADKSFGTRNYDNGPSFLVEDRTINMTPKLRRNLLGTVIALPLAVGPAVFLYYILPHREVLRIIGTDTRRPIGSSKSDASTHMEFFINAEDLETQKPRVFHNEDTRWGFPWYFKFDSAELQAIAQSIANERGTALITYYGWRIKILSVLPNITNIKRAAPDAAPPIPWFNLGFAALVISGTVWIALRIRRLQNRRRVARGVAPGAIDHDAD